MPDELDRALRAHRTALNQRERATRRRMRLAYRDAVTGLTNDLQAAQARITELQASGQPVPTWRLLQETRFRQLLAQAEIEFAGFGERVRLDVVREQQAAVQQAQTDARRLIEAGFGPGPPGVVLPLVTLPTRALSELVGALQPGSPLHPLLRSFGPTTAKTIERELIQGIAAGTNSRVIARHMRAALGGNLVRANTIARTETHRAYRAATLETMRENRHLLKGWRWSSARDRRTCPACLSLDGRIFDLDEPPRMHVNCRCSCSPVTKSWKDLGYDVPEPMARRESGADWFARQAEKIQREMLGPAAYDAYASGDVMLDDFVRLRRSRTWGSSYVRGSVVGARERASKRERKAAA